MELAHVERTHAVGRVEPDPHGRRARLATAAAPPSWTAPRRCRRPPCRSITTDSPPAGDGVPDRIGSPHVVRADLQLAPAPVDPCRPPARSGRRRSGRGPPRRRDGNATTSTPAARPSRRNCAYGSPRFVYFRATAADDAADGHQLAVVGGVEVADLVGALRRAGRPRPPAAGGPRRTSRASPSRTAGAPACRTPRRRARTRRSGRPPRRRRTGRTARRPRPCARRRSGRTPCRVPPRSARRRYPRESNAPARIIDSSARFVRTEGSTFRQKSANDSKRPLAARASITCWTARLARRCARPTARSGSPARRRPRGRSPAWSRSRPAAAPRCPSRGTRTGSRACGPCRPSPT